MPPSGLNTEASVTQLPTFPALLSDSTPLYTPTAYIGPPVDNLETVDNAVGAVEDQLDLLSDQEQMFLETEGSDGLEHLVPGIERLLDPGYPEVRRPSHPL